MRVHSQPGRNGGVVTPERLAEAHERQTEDSQRGSERDERSSQVAVDERVDLENRQVQLRGGSSSLLDVEIAFGD